MELQKNIPIEELRLEIQRLGLSQAQIAASIGRNQGQVSRLINATKTPTTKTYKQICALVKTASPESNSGAGQLVLDAVNRCWDGSMEHAILLAQVLDALTHYRQASQVDA